MSKCRFGIAKDACMGVWLSATFQCMDAVAMSRDRVESCPAPLRSSLSVLSTRVESAESSRSQAQSNQILEEQRIGAGAKVFLALGQWG